MNEFILLFRENETLLKEIIVKDVGTNIVVGSSKDADLQFNNKYLSRVHLQFIFNNERKLILQDLNSTNGTYLNEIKIKPHELKEIKDNDKIKISDSKGLYILVKHTLIRNDKIKHSEKVNIAKNKNTQQAKNEKVNRIEKRTNNAITAAIIIWIIGIGVIIFGEKDNYVYILPITALLSLIYPITGLSSRCPSCKEWFGEKFIRKDFLDSRSFYRTVTRTDKHKNSKGDVIGTTERQEQVKMTTNYYKNYYRCKYCSHKWTKDTSSTYEN